MSQTNPWPFIEIKDIWDIRSHDIDQDFVGVKIGDVNESVILGLQGGLDSRNADQLVLNINTQNYSAGEEIRLEVTSSNFDAVSGYQFTMETKGLELSNVESGAIAVEDANFASFQNNITTSWNNETPVDVKDGEVLFTVVFTAKEAGSTSSLNITSDRTIAEAYFGESYSTGTVVLRGNEGEGAFWLAQNKPNPFDDVTTISFELPYAASATFNVYDVTGKVLMTMTNNYEAGINKITLEKEQLDASGVMYYELSSGDYTETKKMILIK